MKRILSLAVALVATASIAASAASAADWSSSVGKGSVKPGDECAVASPFSGKAWGAPSSWSDGSSFKGSKGKHARVAPKGFHEGSSLKPSCGGGGHLACGQWVMFPGYGGYWYIYVPC